MQIALDTNALYTGVAGVARYIRGLRKGLDEINSGQNTYHNCAWEVSNLSYKQPIRTLKTAYRELFWAPLLAPHFLKKNEIQLLHNTCAVVVVPPQTIRHVVTLHDLAVLRYPERFRSWQRISTKSRYSKLLHANRIICISKFTADEAIKLLQIPAAKIDVVYNGNDFHPEEHLSEKKPDFDLPPEFFLFVGSLEPGKNLSLLRDVYQMAEAKGKVLPPLVIVGARWKGVTNEGVPPKNWNYLGWIPDETLIYLYKRAIALVFPSKYEGFGFPVVEAMSLGCPVICSPISSLPEVAGKAACFSDLTAISYYKSMQLLINDPNMRSDLISKGHVQAKQFSWKKCAIETEQVYKDALHD